VGETRAEQWRAQRNHPIASTRGRRGSCGSATTSHLEMPVAFTITTGGLARETIPLSSWSILLAPCDSKRKSRRMIQEMATMSSKGRPPSDARRGVEG
jgi:hypothetical protein